MLWIHYFSDTTCVMLQLVIVDMSTIRPHNDSAWFVQKKKKTTQIEALYNSESPGTWEEGGLELNCFEFVQF